MNRPWNLRGQKMAAVQSASVGQFQTLHFLPLLRTVDWDVTEVGVAVSLARILHAQMATRNSKRNQKG